MCKYYRNFFFAYADLQAWNTPKFNVIIIWACYIRGSFENKRDFLLFGGLVFCITVVNIRSNICNVNLQNQLSSVMLLNEIIILLVRKIKKLCAKHLWYTSSCIVYSVDSGTQQDTHILRLQIHYSTLKQIFHSLSFLPLPSPTPFSSQETKLKKRKRERVKRLQLACKCKEHERPILPLNT